MNAVILFKVLSDLRSTPKKSREDPKEKANAAFDH
jgi:hypothetical protein